MMGAAPLGGGVKSDLFGNVKRLISSVRTALVRRPKSLLPKAEIAPYVKRIVSDAILFNEIPSPTENESLRTEFILQRLSDFGYANASVDDFGNVSVPIPGAAGEEGDVLLFTDIRNEAYSPIDSLTRLEVDRVCGNGMAENSIGVAALLVLAEYLSRNEIQFDRNVTILFSSFDPGERDVQPLERFLQECKERLRFAVNVRGLELGRVEEKTMGTYKLTVTVRTAEREVIGMEPGVSAITILANVAHRLGGIRWDSENNTFMNVARIEAGIGFGWYASEGTLELEIFSSDKNALEVAKNAVTATVRTLSGETSASVDIAVKAFFPAGNAEINAGLNRILRDVHALLKVKSVPSSVPDHAAFISSLGVPAVSMGVTTGKKSLKEEYVDIKPLETGFRQLLVFLEQSAGSAAGGAQ
jgi:tripeptide aminopeptidase